MVPAVGVVPLHIKLLAGATGAQRRRQTEQRRGIEQVLRRETLLHATKRRLDDEAVRKELQLTERDKRAKGS